MIPATPLAGIQQAVYVRLVGDAELMALITGVYDYVPEDAPESYVVIGEGTETPRDSHDRFGRETTITLHVWSRYRGMAQAQAVIGHLVRLLDHQPLTIPGHHHVATRYEFADTMTDPEPPGDLRHGVVRFRVVTEQT